MHDRSLKNALDDFILQRINDTGAIGTEALQEAYHELNNCSIAINDLLRPEQKPALHALENAYSLLGGETKNCYYRAGFSDAVSLLSGWRCGLWS